MSAVVPLPGARPQTCFDRRELDTILRLYGGMVRAGLWRDYAIDMSARAATFAAFRRAAERPEYRLVKEPERRLRQGQYTLFGEAGQIVKRGDDLAAVLAPAMCRLMRAIAD